MLLPSLGTSIANMALPSLGLSFDSDFAQMQWVVISYLLAVTTLIVGTGHLGDVFGRPRMLLAGIALFALSSLACALSTSLLFLIAARALQGAGATFMMSLTIANVTDALPGEQTGRAMGLLGAVSAVGTAIGPSLGGVVLAWAGWPWLFAVIATLGGVPFAIGARFLERPAHPGAAEPKFDVPRVSPADDRTRRLFALHDIGDFIGRMHSDSSHCLCAVRGSRAAHVGTLAVRSIAQTRDQGSAFVHRTGAVAGLPSNRARCDARLSPTTSRKARMRAVAMRPSCVTIQNSLVRKVMNCGTTRASNGSPSARKPGRSSGTGKRDELAERETGSKRLFRPHCRCTS